MVDFNNETTIGTPAVDIVRVLILQARYNLFEAWEYHQKMLFQGTEGNLSLVRARLGTMFLELQAGLKRRLSKLEYQNLLNRLKDDTMTTDEAFDIICLFNDILDKINLTKIDTKKVYDSSRVEKEHKALNL